jgi:hypothetical protein
MEDAANLFGLAALVLSVSALVHVSAAAWLRWRTAERADRRAADAETLAASLQEQLARVERALDAQGTEIERLGEAQRFAARLLAERAQSGADAGATPRGAARVVTPH